MEIFLHIVEFSGVQALWNLLSTYRTFKPQGPMINNYLVDNILTEIDANDIFALTKNPGGWTRPTQNFLQPLFENYPPTYFGLMRTTKGNMKPGTWTWYRYDWGGLSFLCLLDDCKSRIKSYARQRKAAKLEMDLMRAKGNVSRAYFEEQEESILWMEQFFVQQVGLTPQPLFMYKFRRA
jgi:hypothetical protein